MQTITVPIIIPWFSFENQDLYAGWRTCSEMSEALKRGGFIVHKTFEESGQLLLPDLGTQPTHTIRFEVSLPQGWSLVQGYNGYGLEEPDHFHLLDGKHQLRGNVNRFKQEAEFYCRYALDPFWYRFSHFPPRGTIRNVVLDRAAVDPKRPSDFPVVAFMYEKQVPLSGKSLLESLAEAIEEERLNPTPPMRERNEPVFIWLRNNHPLWQDPFAYW